MHFDSDLIILDEPTNNLGVAETQGVLNFVRGARNSGHSCIFIAHNIHHVFQVVDRIVVMRRGRVVADDIDPKTHHRRGGRGVITGMTADGQPSPRTPDDPRRPPLRPARPPRRGQRPAPAPGPGEVRVRIGAGGICGSDLHYYLHGGFGAVGSRSR